MKKKFPRGNKLSEPETSEAPSEEAFVRFVNVQKSYDGETLVVKDFNLDIASGEFITLLGPSGSGKTTCLMMMAGFEVPTHGQILLGGEPINTVPPHKRGIGMVFQNYALFPHMSVADRKSTRLNSSHRCISYAVFCLKKKRICTTYNGSDILQ